MRCVDLAACTGFEWDPGNRLKSHMKHGVTEAEAEEMFFSSPLVAQDKEHSGSEARFHALGETSVGRRLLAVFTVRRNRIRIISVRDMSRRERKTYEEAQKDSPEVP
jgi:uncharacterized DUF497 family protein